MELLPARLMCMSGCIRGQTEQLRRYCASGRRGIDGKPHQSGEKRCMIVPTSSIVLREQVSEGVGIARVALHLSRYIPKPL